MAESKKRKRLSLAEKMEAVNMLNTGHKAIVVMEKFGIKRRTVTKLKSDEKSILRRADEEGIALDAKAVRPVKFPRLEKRLLQFIKLSRNAKVPVTQEIIQQRALLIRQELLRSDLADVDKEALSKFSASIGWVQKVVKRNGLKSVSLLGQAGNADVAGVDVHTAMVDDFTQALEELDSAVDGPGHITECEDENENEEEDVAAIRQLPGIAEVYLMFQPLQILAYDCNLPDASANLQRALNVFIDAIHKANVGKTR